LSDGLESNAWITGKRDDKRLMDHERAQNMNVRQQRAIEFGEFNTPAAPAPAQSTPFSRGGGALQITPRQKKGDM